jgi:hypothetical protein
VSPTYGAGEVVAPTVPGYEVGYPVETTAPIKPETPADKEKPYEASEPVATQGSYDDMKPSGAVSNIFSGFLASLVAVFVL